MLTVNKLSVHLKSRYNQFYILRDVSINVNKGEIIGIAGESGSGKTVLLKTIQHLIKPPIIKTNGNIRFNGLDINESSVASIRGNKIATIFQNPTSSLNPVLTIGEQVIETIINNDKTISVNEAKEKSIKLLLDVEIDNPEERMKNYPHNLSGGMNQRVMIAIALSSSPELLLADEPTTALDVTIQAQIIRLLLELNKKNNLTIIIVSHDLSLLQKICSKIAVMYSGEILEMIDTVDLIKGNIRHPYTYLLNACSPDLKKEYEYLKVIDGIICKNTNEYENKCIFYERCPYRQDICNSSKPELKNNVKCFYPIK